MPSCSPDWLNNGVDTDFLTLTDLLDIAKVVIGDVSVRDIGLLESAVGRPQATVFGEPAYPDLFEQAAALVHSLARNHALVDGNKRLAWSAMRTMLLLNGSDVRYDVDSAEAFVLAIARGEMEVVAIAAWLRAREVPQVAG